MRKALFVLFLQGSFALAQITPCVPAGNEQIYGNDSWIGYVYDLATAATLPTTPITGFPYKGYVVLSEQFDQNLGTSALTSATLCKNVSDKFGVRYRMSKSYSAGYYAITVGGDDGYMLSVDVGATFTITNWTNASYRTTTKTVYLNGGTSFVLDYYENTGNSRVSFAIEPCGAPSEAPQSMSGLTTTCQGSTVTLTASGGYEKLGAVYQWGKGATVGSSVIAGQTTASITVNPTATTTYWVRRVDVAPCGAYSDAITGVVTVKAPSTAPTSISGNSFVCSGGSITLTTSGGTLQPGAVYEWGTGTTVGLNPMAGAATNSITVSPTTATTYWVRRTDSGVCTSSSAGITKYVDVSIPEGNPTEYGVGQWKGYVYAGNGSQVANDAIFNGAYRGYVTESETFDRVFPGCQISAANLCGTYYTYYGIKYKMNKTFPAGYYNFSMGGDDGFRLSIDGGQTYAFSKWNVQGFTSGSKTIYLNGETNLVYDYFQGPFSIARIKMSVTACTPSEAPTAVDGVTTICKGTNTQLTANGGFTSAGAIYQWGTGATAGTGTISGQTGSSITVSPSSTTNYWVRRVDAAPCSLISPAYTFTVTVKQQSTAPTTLSATTPICTGTSTKLTVTGGTVQAGGVYEWSYGSFAGENVISTTTANNITVTPTTTTQYWVRRFDAAPCSTFTNAVSKTITVIIPAGDPSVFGDSTWNLYGYEGSDLTLQSTTYKGFYVNPDLNFNTQTGTNGWVNTISPSASAGWSGCAVPNEYFTMVAKRKGFPCGTYNLSLSNWDDMTEVYVNGNRIWSCSAWNMANRCSGAIGSYYLDANSRIEIRVREVTGYSNVAFNAALTTPATLATAPSAINSPSAICTGSSASLQATGGVSTANAQYQWGTGTVGSSILGTQNSATLQVSPTESTTYWVRRVDTSCLTVTDATTVTVQVDQAPIAGTVSGNATVCATSNATSLTLNGSQGSVQWQSSANNVDFANLSGGNAATYTATNLTATKYFRAIVSNGVCAASTSNVVTITVQPAAVAGILTGGTLLDSAINSTMLNLNGAVGTIRWEISTNNINFTAVNGQTSSSLTLVNVSQATYIRAVVSSGICAAVTSNAITLLVNLTVGGSLSGNQSYCQGASNSSVLTLNGQVGNVVRWESFSNADFSGTVTNINNTTTSLILTNVTSSTYYRAVVSNNGFPSKYSTSASVAIIGSSLSIQEIQGLQSLCAISQTTYSVPTVVGATNYVWTFPAGISAATNTAGNSVLVNVDPLFQEGTITVKAFNACSTTGIKTIDVLKKPIIILLTGPTSTCGATTATYSATLSPADPKAVYTWNVPNGFTITSGVGTSSITVSIDNNVFTSTGYINAIAVSDCGTSPTKFFTISAIQAPSTITGREEVCGITSTTYSTPANASASSFIWSVPTGMSITIGQGFNQITVAIDQNVFTSGNVSVVTSYSCGTSLPKTLLVNKAQKPGNITGPSALCGVSEITYDTQGQIVNYVGGNVVYSIPAVSGATNYNWVVPQGATILSGQGTNTINVTFNFATFVSGTISVNFTNQCGLSLPSLLDVRRSGTYINGFSQLCDIKSNVTYTVPNTVGTNFAWRVPSWMRIVSGQNTNQITVSITGSICSDYVFLDFVSNCNTNESISLTVGCGSTSKVDATFCGATIASEYTQIYANTVSGASSYKFRLIKGLTTQFITSSTPTFSLNQLTTWAFGDTFTVDVAPIIGGVQGGFGCSCAVALAYPLPVIQSSTCGTTLSNVDNRIYCSSITSASSYRFEVTNGATVRTYDSSTNSFTLSQLTGGSAYGITYSIRVAAFYNNVWSAYGASCNVTTPSTPTSRIDSSVCGTTLASLWTTLYASQLSGVTVQSYRFEVTNLSTNAVLTYDNTVSNFSLMLITGGAKFATSYAIRVAVKVNGSWQQYGASCTVTTPGPTTKIQASQCGITISNLWTTFYADDVTGATGYSFEVTNGATVRSIVRSVKSFSLMMLTGGASLNVTYSVRVASIYNGTLQAYGPVCTITTFSPTARTIVTEEPNFVFDARVFPNPFESNFGISIDTSSDQMIGIRAFDMLGKELQAIEVAPQDLHTITLGEQYPTGVYQLIVTQGTDSKVLRVIKR